MSLLVLVPTRDVISKETTECFAYLPKSATLRSLVGCSDVTLARNVLLTDAFDSMRANSAIEGALFIDDDIVFNRSNVEALLEQSQTLGNIATAGAYGHGQGSFAATRFGRSIEGPGRKPVPLFYTGAGFLFIPRRLVLDLGGVSRVVSGPEGRPVRAFTQSHPGPEMWHSEDYELCWRLGGVPLVTTVGHVKRMTLYPDPASFARLLEQGLETVSDSAAVLAGVAAAKDTLNEKPART